MSKKRRRDKTERSETFTSSNKKTVDESGNLAKIDKKGIFAYLKVNWLVALIIAVLSLGAFGAGLKYLEDDAKRELAKRESRKGNLLEKQEESFLNSINPFLPAPVPNPTPQLSKELIYSGSKLVSVV